MKSFFITPHDHYPFQSQTLPQEIRKPQNCGARAKALFLFPIMIHEISLISKLKTHNLQLSIS